MRAMITILFLAAFFLSLGGCSGDQPAHRHETSVNLNGSSGD